MSVSPYILSALPVILLSISGQAHAAAAGFKAGWFLPDEHTTPWVLLSLQVFAEGQLVFRHAPAPLAGPESAAEKHLPGARVLVVDAGNHLLPAQLEECDFLRLCQAGAAIALPPHGLFPDGNDHLNGVVRRIGHAQEADGLTVVRADDIKLTVPVEQGGEHRSSCVVDLLELGRDLLMLIEVLADMLIRHPPDQQQQVPLVQLLSQYHMLFHDQCSCLLYE